MPNRAKQARRAARDAAATKNFFNQAPSVQPEENPEPPQSQPTSSETCTSSISHNPDGDKDFPAQKSTCRHRPTAEQIVIRAVSFHLSLHFTAF